MEYFGTSRVEIIMIYHMVSHSAEIYLLTNRYQNLAEDTFKRFGPIL